MPLLPKKLSSLNGGCLFVAVSFRFRTQLQAVERLSTGVDIHRYTKYLHVLSSEERLEG